MDILYFPDVSKALEKHRTAKTDLDFAEFLLEHYGVALVPEALSALRVACAFLSPRVWKPYKKPSSVCVRPCNSDTNSLDLRPLPR